MPPSSPPSYLFCTQADVESLLSADGLTGRLDDDESGTASAGELAYLTQAIRWSTVRVQMYCNAYPAEDLVNSWLVNWWASIIAAFMVSVRRGNPSASSLSDLHDAAMEDLKLVRSGEYTLPDVALRDSAFPAWSNMSCPAVGRSVAKLRVQTSISSRKGNQSGRIVDGLARIVGDIEKSAPY